MTRQRIPLHNGIGNNSHLRPCATRTNALPRPATGPPAAGRRPRPVPASGHPRLRPGRRHHAGQHPGLRQLAGHRPARQRQALRWRTHGGRPPAHRGQRRGQHRRRHATHPRRAGHRQLRHGKQFGVAEHRRARPDRALLAALDRAAGWRTAGGGALWPTTAVVRTDQPVQHRLDRRGAWRRCRALRPAERGRHHQLQHPRHSDRRGPARRSRRALHRP